MFRFTALVSSAMLLIAMRPAIGSPITINAHCGLNDQDGINADPTPDSPYTFGQTVHGRGSSEPGWNGHTWVVSADGGSGGHHLGIAVADDSLEGDGVLYARKPDHGYETWVYRRWGDPLSSPFLIEQQIRLPANGYFQSRPGRGGVGSLIGPHWKVTGGKFYARDGDGKGGGSFEDTGFVLQPMQWHKVGTFIDPVSKTYQFFVDDQRYDAPDPLDFRGNPGYIDRVEYLTQADAWLDQIRVVPEPSTLVLLCMGAFGLLAHSWRRRR